MTTYNLTTEPWLPCSDQQGQLIPYSLTSVFQHAHQIHDLEADNPLMQAALYRFLLAVLHRAYAGPNGSREWKKLWKQGAFSDSTIIDYLTEHQDCFDLFSTEKPFYQTAGFTGKSGTVSVSKLFHELTSANNKTLFDHTLDANPPRLTSAQAARALIMFQGYAFGGGVSASSNLFSKHPNFTHSPLLKGVCVFLKGNNLFETLLLNALPYYDAHKENVPIPRLLEEADLPVWERDDLKRQPSAYTPRGYLEYLTWYSRHLRLIPEEQHGEIFVSQMYLAQAEALAGNVRDPFFALLQKDENQDPQPLKLSTDKALWRDSGSLFIYKHGEGYGELSPKHISNTKKLAREFPQLKQLSLHLIGLGLPKDGKANPQLWRSEILPITPEFLLDDNLPIKLKNALQYAEDIGSSLNKSTFILAKELQTAGSRSPDAKLVNNTIQNLKTTHLFWSRMEGLFQIYLSDLSQPNPDDVQQSWYKNTTKLAQDIFAEATQNCLGYSAREMRARAKTLDSFNRITNTMLKHKNQPNTGEKQAA